MPRGRGFPLNLGVSAADGSGARLGHSRGNRHIMEPFQIIGILAIIGLIVALVVMRKKDGAATKSTTTTSKSSTRI
jgi:hypothetical protein